MKLRNLLLGLLLCATAASAQDVITKTDGSKIDAKVEEITDVAIRYRKASNPTGPIYTVPVASVATIVYENGSVDKFNEATPATAIGSSPLSDDALIRYAEANNITGTSTTTMNDAELIRLAKGNLATAQQLRKRAKTYRIIGWTSGAVLGGAGLIILTAMRESYFYMYEGGRYIGIAGIAVGVGSCLGFNLKARSLIKQAQEIEMYSSTIIEDNILSFGNKSLMAGVNVMGNRMTHTQGVGLSLKLNF